MNSTSLILLQFAGDLRRYVANNFPIVEGDRRWERLVGSVHQAR